MIPGAARHGAGLLQRGWSGARRGIGPDPRWLEATSGVAGALWGAAALCLPSGQGGSLPLALFLPPAVWGVLFLFGGLLQLAAVLLDHTEARAPLAAAAGSGWLLVAYDVAAAVPFSPNAIVPAILGAADGAAMLLLIGLVFRGRR